MNMGPGTFTVYLILSLLLGVCSFRYDYRELLFNKSPAGNPTENPSRNPFSREYYRDHVYGYKYEYKPGYGHESRDDNYEPRRDIYEQREDSHEPALIQHEESQYLSRDMIGRGRQSETKIPSSYPHQRRDEDEMRKQETVTVAEDGWSSWDSWSRCTVSCGEGLTTRSRVCMERSEKRGCYGPIVETKRCLTTGSCIN